MTPTAEQVLALLCVRQQEAGEERAASPATVLVLLVLHGSRLVRGVPSTSCAVCWDALHCSF